jgi:hypothetical protein
MNSYPTVKEKITDLSKLSLNTNRKLEKNYGAMDIRLL